MSNNVRSVNMKVENSSLIDDIQWTRSGKHPGNDPLGTLTLVFKNGDVYDYTDVPHQIANELADSESVGQYFCSHIKNKYNTYKQVLEVK